MVKTSMVMCVYGVGGGGRIGENVGRLARMLHDHRVRRALVKRNE